MVNAFICIFFFFLLCLGRLAADGMSREAWKAARPNGLDIPPGSYLASCAGCQMETVGNHSDRVLRCELCETGCDNRLKEAMLAGPCAADEQPRNSYGALICEKYTETEDFDADAATAYASKMRVQQLREELYLLGVSTRNMLYWDQLVDAYVGALRAGTPRRYGPRRQRHCHCYPSS